MAVVCVLGWGQAGMAWAQSPVDTSAQELLRQQERERALRERQETAPDVRLQAGTVPDAGRLPHDEAPCFVIRQIVLQGAGEEDVRRFQWALRAADPPADPATGRCLGTQGVNRVMARIQDAIIARGYVTTRILAAPQDLAGGTLALTVVPGRIRHIRFADPAARTAWRNAVPARPGDLLNLRDIEQALENFQRIPTVAADIRIEAADGDARPGESDLAIAWQQRAPARFSLTLDDAGSEATGKLQAGATLSLDNGLRANDLFYLSLGRGVFNGSGRNTSSWTAHYDVPSGYWLLGATASSYDYHQAVAGAFQSYIYSGTSRNAELRLSRLLFRNATSKTGVYARGWARESSNFIDDTEVEVQRRRMGGWELGLTHKRFMGAATLDADLAYRRGTGAFGALPAPEQAFDEGTARARILAASAQFAVPFRLGAQQLRYGAAWRAQWHDTRLVPQDRFAIGGRYTVRGFDGETSLVGDRGWLVRNDIGLALGGGQELYLGADYGHVGGPAAQWQLGEHLAGMAIGLRGGGRGLYWDGFVGAPLVRPAGFPTAYTTVGFSLAWSH